MPIPIIVPELGLGEMEFGLWLVSVGEQVREGERLVEINSGPAMVELASPVTGRLSRRTAYPGDRLVVGATLGWIEAEE